MHKGTAHVNMIQGAHKTHLYRALRPKSISYTLALNSKK
jgi:hypothetical protein